FGILGIVAFMAPAPSGAWHFVIIASVLLVTAILRGWFGAINKGLGIILAFVPHVVVFGIMMAIDGQWIIARIRVTFDPFIDPLGRGFLAAQARGLLSGAAFVGEGVLPPRFPQEWLFSPSFYAYRPLTTVISRFGWLAVIVILAAVAAFIVATSAKCAKQRSGLGFFVSLAVIVTFSVQAVMYTLFNLGITIPMISLPFISPGNFAMVVNMGLAGFMLSVFRTGDVVTDGYFPSRKRSDFISWDDGKIIIRVK
ncbi:MAG: FtsW/RodA/SpoVE family cell cycle protein, partial [Lentimicrobiaceae bacterium]|nr:FtsW/RodA/SpoVE family cell cycle protein [Lentimicrobiaceae bacterium]